MVVMMIVVCVFVVFVVVIVIRIVVAVSVIVIIVVIVIAHAAYQSQRFYSTHDCCYDDYLLLMFGCLFVCLFVVLFGWFLLCVVFVYLCYSSIVYKQQ